MGKVEVIWTINAQDRLDDIEKYIGMNNPERAMQFTNLLIEKSLLLSKNPSLGRVVPEFADPNLRELIVKNYRIVYRQHQDRISILTVYEGHYSIELKDINLDSTTYK